MDNVNADDEPNASAERHGPCMHSQAWKVRFYPTDAQKKSLTQWFGHARWMWNTALNMRSKAWARRQENVTGVDVGKKLTDMKKRISWLSNVPTSCLQQASGPGQGLRQLLRRTGEVPQIQIEVPKASGQSDH